MRAEVLVAGRLARVVDGIADGGLHSCDLAIPTLRRSWGVSRDLPGRGVPEGPGCVDDLDSGEARALQLGAA